MKIVQILVTIPPVNSEVLVLWIPSVNSEVLVVTINTCK
jgi:hypothetical protein